MLVWLPLWFIFEGSLMSVDEIGAYLAPVLSGATGFAFWPLLPAYPTLQPLVQILLDTPQFFVMFWNTCLLVFPTIAGQILIGAPAAWTFSRMRFRGRKVLFTFYIILMLLPFQVTMVSNYLVADTLGTLNTAWSIILPGIFSTFPIFIMKKSFDAVPMELIESASIEGAGPLQIFFRIGIPMGMPGIMSASILTFFDVWNNVEQPLVFLSDKSKWPLSLYLPQMMQDNLGLAMASAMLMLLPALLIFFFGQKYLELGIQASGLKE